MAVDHEKVSAFVFFFLPTAILSVRRESEEQLINAFNLLIEIENSEVCAQALLPKLGCFNNEDDEAHLLFFLSFS